MAAGKQKFTLEDLIMMLVDQMNAVYRMADEALPLAEQLKLLDMLGKTCSRLASLIEQQRKTQGDDSSQLNMVLQEVLSDLRKQGDHE